MIFKNLSRVNLFDVGGKRKAEVFKLRLRKSYDNQAIRLPFSPREERVFPGACIPDTCDIPLWLSILSAA